LFSPPFTEILPLSYPAPSHTPHTPAQIKVKGDS
jgi:hypothetical protein